MALVKLAETTGEQRYADLAEYFVRQRGQQPLYFELEVFALADPLRPAPWRDVHALPAGGGVGHGPLGGAGGAGALAPALMAPCGA